MPVPEGFHAQRRTLYCYVIDGAPDQVPDGGLMGKMLYGDSEMQIDLDDRALAHLHVVIGAKLRRGESFFFSWKDDLAVGGGRSSIWLDQSIPLYFRYTGGKNTTINREWLETLTKSASSGQGLVFTSEVDGVNSPPRGHV